MCLHLALQVRNSVGPVDEVVDHFVVENEERKEWWAVVVVASDERACLHAVDNRSPNPSHPGLASSGYDHLEPPALPDRRLSPQIPMGNG